MKIKAAIPADHIELSRLTKLSKAYWGYSAEQMAAWDADLALSESYLETHQVFKLVDAEKILAYYSFQAEDENTAKLDNLFVLPQWIGKGLGKKLMAHFLSQVKACNFERILLDADPNVAQFYLKLGFQVIGQQPSSIPSRFLPIMELKM